MTTMFLIVVALSLVVEVTERLMLGFSPTGLKRPIPFPRIIGGVAVFMILLPGVVDAHGNVTHGGRYLCPTGRRESRSFQRVSTAE